MEQPLALVVDEDSSVRTIIRDAFEARDIVALGASGGAEVRDLLRSRPVRILVVDDGTPGVNVFELLQYGLQLRPAPILIGVFSDTERQRATEFVRAGALDVLERSSVEREVPRVVERALRHHRLIEQMRELREELQSREGYHGIVGRSPQMERLREQIARYATVDGPIWLWGEPGTGKELCVRTLHARRRGPDSPIAVLDCGELDENRWDATLGSRGGSALADLQGGALYLDNVHRLGLVLQSRLAQLVGPGGPADPASVDEGRGVRVFSSSTIDPAEAVEQGHLLEEVHAALAPACLSVPPLRERKEDIPILARHFIHAICSINRIPPIDLDAEALTLLERYRWPENVQELRNAMEQAVILSPDGKIRARELPDAIREGQASPEPGGAPSVSSTRCFRDAKKEVVELFERSYLGDLMRRHGGNVTAAAQQAGMLRSALQRLLRKYGLKSAEFRKQRQAVGGDGVRPSSG